jgi:hypothetical protein
MEKLYRVLKDSHGTFKRGTIVKEVMCKDSKVPLFRCTLSNKEAFLIGALGDNPEVELIEEKRNRGGEGIGPSKASESQVDGNHYSKLKIQPIEYCFKNNLNVCQSKAIKYITRYNSKGTPLKDLEKAIHCLQLLIELEELRDE